MIVKTWSVPDLERTKPERAQSSRYWVIRALEEASPQEVCRAVRDAVRAYARDPSERNAFNVELAVVALRRQRARSRG